MTSLALDTLLERERQRYAETRPRSRALAQAAGAHFEGGVPMHWMRDWPLPFPLYVESASGVEVIDVDGHRYVDFCLGDTGAMFGHSPPAVARAVAAQASRGLTVMLPDARIASIGARLTQLFGLPHWQITQTATDANRAVLRRARQITGRQKILVFDGCYHGTVDETMVALGEDGLVRSRAGQVGPAHDPRATTVVVEFNDLPAVEAALGRGDIACVLAEPVMTNAGMVLPQPGFLEALRAQCTSRGVLLVLDETHTLSSGPGGYAKTQGIAADFLVCGKAIAGGVACAVWGASEAVAARIRAADATRESGHSGIGTTLAANPLAIAALDASLVEVLTPSAWQRMDEQAGHLARGLAQAFARQGLRWQVSRVGARLEFGRAPAPHTARQSLAAIDPALEAALHLYLLNRGFLLTPFHNMMLVSPVTTRAHIEAFLGVFETALDEFALALGAR